MEEKKTLNLEESHRRVALTIVEQCSMVNLVCVELGYDPDEMMNSTLNRLAINKVAKQLKWGPGTVKYSLRVHKLLESEPAIKALTEAEALSMSVLRELLSMDPRDRVATAQRVKDMKAMDARAIINRVITQRNGDV